MSTKPKEPKSKKSTEGFKLSFEIKSPKEKNNSRIQAARASIYELDDLVLSLSAMNADAHYISKTEEQVRELKAEFNSLTQGDRQNPDGDAIKALKKNANKIEVEVKNYTSDIVLEKLQPYRDKETLSEEQFNELVQLQKTSAVEFQQKVVKSLLEQKWLEIKPDVAECCKTAKTLAFENFFEALGQQKLADQARGLAALKLDADSAADVFRLDFKSAVRCGNTIISQFRILEAEFKRIVEQPKGSIRDFVARPIEENRRLQAIVAFDGMLGAPKLGPANFSAVTDWYTRAIEAEKITGSSQALGLAKLGISAYGELQTARQEYLLEAKLWDQTEGTRLKNRSSLTAIALQLGRRKTTEQTNPNIERNARVYLKRLDAIEKLARGDTVKNKLDAYAAWKNEKGALEASLKIAENGFIAQLNPKPRDEWKTKKEQNPNSPEAVYDRAIKGGNPNRAAIRLLAAKGDNIRLPEDLSLGEVAAITAYTNDDDCKVINGALNGTPILRKTPEEIEAYKELAQVVVEAMKKLPQYPNETARGEKLWSGAEERYQVGNEFAIKAFWSTSFGAQFPGVYQLAIRPKNNGAGKNVQVLSELPKENEILFPPDTRFKVVTVTGTIEEGRINVKLQEI